jgi:TolA protein
MGRMVVLSAVLHVAVIVFLFVITSRNRSESSPRLMSHTVELVNPGVLASTGRGRGEAKLERKEPSAAKRPTESPQEKPEKAQVKEPPPPKPPQVRKEVEQPKPKELPPKAQETSKVVAAKPRSQEPPAAKPKPIEPVKPKEIVKLPEKSAKAEPKPQSKPVEKEKPQVKSPPLEKSQPEKKPTGTAQKSEQSVPAKQKSESVSPPSRKETKTEEHEDGEIKEREEQILTAVEKIRANEEAAEREKEIATALERVRRSTAEREIGGTTNREAPLTVRQEQGGMAPGSVEGSGSPGYGVEFITYTQHIKQKVKDAWILAERKPGLRAVVRFGVEGSGQVMDVELADSSGDRTFDQSALRAVSKASPFPSPPEAYREEFATQKVEITFSGEEQIR